MAVPGWVSQPTLWHTLIIDGMRVPGPAFVRGGHERREDQLPAPGEEGELVTHLGYGGAVFEVEVLLWEEQHAARWQTIYERLKPRKGSPARAVRVDHPAINLTGATQLYVRRITTAEPDRYGLWRAHIELVEFVPRKRRRKQAHAAEVKAEVSLEDIPVAQSPSSQGLLPPRPRR